MLEYVSLAESQELDHFVTHHPRGHFMQTSLWGKFKGDWDWVGVIARREDGSIAGTMSILLHKISHLPYHMLYAPRGPIFDYADWDTLQELLEGAKHVAAEQKGYMLRIDPQYEKADDAAAAAFKKAGLSIDSISDFGAFQARMVYQLPIPCNDVEEMFSQCHSKTRYNIRLAMKRGVTVNPEGVESVPAFYAMMQETGAHDGFTPKSEAYYRNLLNVFGPNARLYIARKDGEAIAGAICVQQEKKTWFVYGGSHLAYRNNMPNYLLQWTMISWAIESGCDLYDFRGVEGYPVEENPMYGLHRFKHGFNANFVEYLGQMDLIYKPLAKKLIDTAQKIVK